MICRFLFEEEPEVRIGGIKNGFQEPFVHGIRQGGSGKTGIRTLGTVARSPHFECGPIDHSGIFPFIAAQK